MKKAIAIAVAGAMFSGACAHAQDSAPSLEEMWKIIQQQQAEIKGLKSQLKDAEEKVEEIDVKVIATADAVEQGVGQAAAGQSSGGVGNVSIGGYGEHHYNNFDDRNSQIDAHRFVLFFGYDYTDDIRFFSEFELEHGVAGEGEPGEVELEQAFIQWDYTDNHSVLFGQFLLPVGILNETHEPDTFYGTERNRVESEVIPATWWEAGVMLQGQIAPGLSYNAAVHSGLAVTNFRIRSGRQKNAEAIAEDFAYTARIKYTGVAGLELAATAQYQEDIAQGQLIDDAPATLVEAHAIYQTGDFAVRALWAEWDISGDDFEAADADLLSGWYVEPSYKLTDKLGFFVRYSEYDRGNRPDVEFESYDYGVNYWLHPNVVLKADYTDTVGDGDEGDAFNLGVGWQY